MGGSAGTLACPTRFPTMDVIACSSCFADHGLQLDAMQLGEADTTACPSCGRMGGKKLSKDRLAKLAYRFVVWGSFLRTE